MNIEEFLENCPIGKEVPFTIEADVREKWKILGRNSRKAQSAAMPGLVAKAYWVVVLPRVQLFCERCGDTRNFNPITSSDYKRPCLEIGTGPFTHTRDDGRDMLVGARRDQFLHYICSDCESQLKKYALAVEILSVAETHPGQQSTEVEFKLTKYGEIPKPVKALNSRIKRIIGDQWELYRKGADDEAAGNGIGAFAYYRLVVEGSRNKLVEAICNAAEKLEVPEAAIQEIRASLAHNQFSRTVEEIDHLFPNDLKFGGRNVLATLWGSLSAGLHPGKTDQECLEAAANVRILLDAFGERLEQIITQEDRIQHALQDLEKFYQSSG